VFVALAERYLLGIEQMSLDVDEAVASWQELIDIQFERVRVIYDTRAPVRKILLGPGYSYEIFSRDIATTVVNASRSLELMGRRFEMRIFPICSIGWSKWSKSAMPCGCCQSIGTAELPTPVQSSRAELE